MSLPHWRRNLSSWPKRHRVIRMAKKISFHKVITIGWEYMPQVIDWGFQGSVSDGGRGLVINAVHMDVRGAVSLRAHACRFEAEHRWGLHENARIKKLWAGLENMIFFYTSILPGNFARMFLSYILKESRVGTITEIQREHGDGLGTLSGFFLDWCLCGGAGHPLSPWEELNECPWAGTTEWRKPWHQPSVSHIHVSGLTVQTCRAHVLCLSHWFPTGGNARPRDIWQ